MAYRIFQWTTPCQLGRRGERSQPWLMAGLGLCLGFGPGISAQAIPEATAEIGDCSGPKWSVPIPLEFEEGCDRSVALPIQAKPEISSLPFLAQMSPPATLTAGALSETSEKTGPNNPLDLEPIANVSVAENESGISEPDVDPELDESMPPGLTPNPETNESVTPELDIDPEILENSPVLRRWLEDVPDVAADINRDPAFRTRVRLGYANFPSTEGTGGIFVGVQDVFVGQTPLTLSAEYAANGRGDRESIGLDAQYYLLPLGWYANVAPVLGYRSVEVPELTSDGVHIGFRVVVIPSRGGAADLSLAQTWVAPGSDHEVRLTTFSFGYAVAQDLRLATDIQLQRSPAGSDNRVGLLLEWLL